MRSRIAAVALVLLASCTTAEQWQAAASTIEVTYGETYSDTSGAFRVGKDYGQSSTGYFVAVGIRPFDAFHVQKVRVERISQSALEPDPPPKAVAPANPNPLAFDGFDLSGRPPCDPDPVSLAGLNDPDPAKRP